MLPLRELPLIFHRPPPESHRDARAVGNARLLDAGRAGFASAVTRGFGRAVPCRGSRARRSQSPTPRRRMRSRDPRDAPSVPQRFAGAGLSRGKINKMCGREATIGRSPARPTRRRALTRGAPREPRWRSLARGRERWRPRLLPRRGRAVTSASRPERRSRLNTGQGIKSSRLES